MVKPGRQSRPPDRLAAAVGQHPAAAGAAADGLQRALEVQAAGLREQQRLGHAEHGDHHQDLVDQLAALPGAGRPDVSDRPAHRL